MDEQTVCPVAGTEVRFEGSSEAHPYYLRLCSATVPKSSCIIEALDLSWGRLHPAGGDPRSQGLFTRHSTACCSLGGGQRNDFSFPDTQQRDRQIREELRNCGYEVIEIQYGQLFDREAMRQHFYRIGRFLLGKTGAEQVRDESMWFE